MLWPLVPDEKYIKMIYHKRQEAFLEEADRKRLIRQEHPVHQTRLERMLYGVGGFLISVGKRLRSRYAPVISPEREGVQAKVEMNSVSSYGWMKESSILGIPKGSDWPEPSANATMISLEHIDC